MTNVANPATATDVTNAFERPLTTAELGVVQNWLDQAWTILTLTLPDVDTRMLLPGSQPTAVPHAAVVQVLVAMVERKLRNPDGLRQWNGDDYTEQIDQVLSSGQLYPTPDELDRLRVRLPGAAVYVLPLSG